MLGRRQVIVQEADSLKIENVSIRNFRCFGRRGTKIKLENALPSTLTVTGQPAPRRRPPPRGYVASFVGGNGSGKTAVFQALSRVFGVTPAQRTVRRQDF